MNSVHDPVSDLQLNQLRVDWVPHDALHPNAYNPNRMTYHDRLLLRQSILEDGWTQPIVTLPDGTIVDGEQRWRVAGSPLHVEDITQILETMQKRREQGYPESDSIIGRLQESLRRLHEAGGNGDVCIAHITGGLVPRTIIDLGDNAHKMLSTIRHNRARGTHQLDAMVDITQDLVSLGLSIDDLEMRLGMDDEEIERFLHAAEGQLAELETELASTPHSAQISIQHIADHVEDPGIRDVLHLSDQAERRIMAYQGEEVQRPILRKFQVFVMPIEYKDMLSVLEPEWATRLVAILRWVGKHDKLAEIMGEVNGSPA